MAQAVVGLGNPGEAYRATRHNVGQRVVDLLAHALSRRFAHDDQAMLASGRWRGDILYLIKPLTFMNLIGAPLARLGRRLALGPADYVLVYDEIDLPLGTVRMRMKGGHAGHNGVRSIIEALQTSDIRRVRIGIGKPLDKAEVPEYVLTPFTPEELPLIESACTQAVDRVLELVAAR